jgi:hypothetical protein
MYSVFLRVNVYLATLLRTYVFDQPFNMFYYIALKYGNFLLETLDTFPMLNGWSKTYVLSNVAK